MSRYRFTRDRTKPADAGWALFKDAVQSASADLPELLWLGASVGWVVAWD